jgi:hypothetical protein
MPQGESQSSRQSMVHGLVERQDGWAMHPPLEIRGVLALFCKGEYSHAEARHHDGCEVQ